MDHAYHAIAGLRKEAMSLINDRFTRFIADRIVSIVDVDKVMDQGLMWKAHIEYMERAAEVRKTNRRDPVIDFETEVVLLPLRGKILGLVYCESDSMRHWIMTQPFLKDYSYWDNTDPDEDVSEEDWEAREQDWEDALGSKSPAECGLTIQLHPNLNLLQTSREEVFPHIMHFESRLDLAASRELYNELVRERLKDKPEPTMGDMIEVQREHQLRLRADLSLIPKMKERLRPTLREITMDDL